MKGLREYIEVHGKHFTESLARDIVRYNWDIDKIRKDVQDRVYYNVTGSTLGDMVYLMDVFHRYVPNHGKCITLMLSWVGDYGKSTYPFCMWAALNMDTKKEFDITPYI